MDIDTLGIKTYFCSNVCCHLSKRCIRKLVVLWIRTIFNEDMIMAHAMIDAGYRIAYQAEAKVIHSHVILLFAAVF